jgi:hypothetical protein
LVVQSAPRRKDKAMTLIEQIKTYALDHYNDAYYWSTIVECYTDAELQAEIEQSKATDLDGFIRFQAPVIDVLDDRLNHAINSVF